MTGLAEQLHINCVVEGVETIEHLAALPHDDRLLIQGYLSNRNWTYLSPSAGLITAGERTGRFRTGTDQILVTASGTSDISAEDLAVAIIDEAETPRHVQRRFTAGY